MFVVLVVYADSFRFVSGDVEQQPVGLPSA